MKSFETRDGNYNIRVHAFVDFKHVCLVKVNPEEGKMKGCINFHSSIVFLHMFTHTNCQVYHSK